MKKMLLAFLILTTTSCFAISEQQKISLKDAIEFALSTNPQINMARVDVERARNDIKIANKLQNPAIHTFQNMGEAGEGNPQQIGADYVIELLKRGKRKELAKSNSKIVADNQQFQEHNLILEVKKAYVDLLLKKSNLNVISEQKKLSKELLDSAVKEEKEGKIPKTDVVQSKIAYNRNVMYYNIAKSEVISSRNRFNAVMNTSNIEFDTEEEFLNGQFDELLTAKPTEDKLNLEIVKDYAVRHRHDLLSAKHSVNSAENNLKVIKSKLIPDIELTGGYGYQSGSTSSTGKFQNGAYVGMSLVNIPLMYRYRPEIKNAKLEIEKAQLHYADVETDVIRSVTDAWEKFVISRDNLNFYNNELLVNSKELLIASVQGLATKEINITTFLVSKKLYLEMMISYYDTLKEYYVSYAELLKEMNLSNIDEIETEIENI